MTFKNASYILLVLCAGAFGRIPAAYGEAKCTYSTWVWDTRSKRSESHARVNKPYSEVTKEETDPHSRCTVCEEDQEAVRVEGIPEFFVCRDFAETVRRVMTEIKASGFPVYSISAYRVGRTKGAVDPRGLRTQFSHHSFGTAIDINSEINGLYTDCYRFGPGCRLLRGGPWNPGRAGTVTRDSAVYKAFRKAGWKWGGELDGRQKDFMHFSLSGD